MWYARNRHRQTVYQMKSLVHFGTVIVWKKQPTLFWISLLIFPRSETQSLPQGVEQDQTSRGFSGTEIGKENIGNEPLADAQQKAE